MTVIPALTDKLTRMIVETNTICCISASPDDICETGCVRATGCGELLYFATAPCARMRCQSRRVTLGAHAQRGLRSVIPSVRLSVCYHVFCHYAQQGGQKAIPTGSVPHWLDFKNGDFRKSTAFKSYGLKTKRTSQYANEHGLPRPDSARFRARWRQ